MPDFIGKFAVAQYFFVNIPVRIRKKQNFFGHLLL